MGRLVSTFQQSAKVKKIRENGVSAILVGTTFQTQNGLV